MGDRAPARSAAVGSNIDAGFCRLWIAISGMHEAGP